MDKAVTFIEFINEKYLLQELTENYKTELTQDEEDKIDKAIDAFVEEYLKNNKTVLDLENDIVKEGVLSSILGGLTGFALGKAIGKIIAKVLGIEKGIMYDMLTSRLVSAALGAAIGRNL